MRKDKYSIDYLSSLKITEIIPIWLDLKDRSLLESASYWFDSIIDKITDEAKKPLVVEGVEYERTDSYISDKTRELELKYFGESLERFFKNDK